MCKYVNTNTLRIVTFKQKKNKMLSQKMRLLFLPVGGSPGAASKEKKERAFSDVYPSNSSVVRVPFFRN